MARIIKLIFLIIPFIPAIYLFSQTQTSQFDEYDIPAIVALQDCDGLMWFGTSRGLVKYDGYEPTVYSFIPFDSTSISGHLILSMFEESDSMLWIATYGGGLNRFNKYTGRFTHYRHDPADSNSISGDHLIYLAQGKDGSLWIGAWQTGLTHLYWDSTGKAHFKRYQHDPANPNSPSDSTISHIYIDREGILWLGTNLGGLNRFDPVKEEFTHYMHDPQDNSSLSFDCISQSICEDNSGNLWIGTGDIWSRIGGGGLNKLDRRTGKFTHYKHDPADSNSLASDNIKSLFIDSEGILWIGTVDKGLNSIPIPDLLEHEKRGTPVKFKHYQLNYNYIARIYEDRQKNIWVCHGGCLSKLDPNKSTFTCFQHIEGDPQSLSSNNESLLRADRSDNLWFGFSNNLDCYNPTTQKWIHYSPIPDGYRSFPSGLIRMIFEDSNGNLWIGSSVGLSLLDRKTNHFKLFQHNRINFQPGGGANKVSEIFEDHNGKLWIGSVGLFIFNPEKEEFIDVDLSPDSPQQFDILDIIEDFAGTLWMGTVGNGLFRVIPENENCYKIVNYRYNHDNFDGIASDWINDLPVPDHTDSNRIWIATNVSLDCFDLRTNKFTHVFYKEIPEIETGIIKILRDEQGNLWLGTSLGMVKYDIQKNTFKKYSLEDGLPFESIGSGCKRSNGELVFSGVGGAFSFYPEDLKENPYIPPVTLTDFKLLQQDFHMDTVVQYAKKILLTHKQNFFSFKFAALNYSSSNKNQYAYKLEGVDRDWVYTDASNRLVSYTDISPGTYVFRVKGSNNDGVWNEEGTSIKVIILPPWWRTDWAYAGYILLIGLAAAGTWRMQVRRLRMKHQLEMEHLQAEKLQEIDHAKSRFFANISHEFRTPLTLILGPISKTLEKIGDKTIEEELNIAMRSALRLRRLIDQLLDFSRLEAGKMKLQAREVNLTDFLKPLILSFASWAETRKINLKFMPPESPILIYLDPEMMEKVVNNLLSNALKFTGAGGRIDVTAGATGPVAPTITPHLTLTVTDSGPGIPADKLPHIFDRFYQADESVTRHHEGTGIGLALTKELVELHHGEITVESDVGKGSSFTIRLPLGRDHLKEEEISTDGRPETGDGKLETGDGRPEAGGGKPEYILQDADLHPATSNLHPATSIQHPATSILHPASSNQHPAARKKLPTLLIVEDNADMRRYMADYLEKEYRIMTAVDGKEGFEKSTREHFDLIISDVMMPGIDGFELCKKLKTDERTSHIPIILLTAKADAGSKLEGLELGADDYITKPFDVKELQLRVRNLIEQRRKLRERFQKEMKLEPKRLAVTSLDQRLLQSILRVVEKNLGNPQFGGERLVKELGMSRANLHRKLKALTNHSAGSFIQVVRLKKAAQLIEQKFDTITQIAYLVGFNNPSYFSECFRRHFGCTPSEYSHQDN